MGKLDLPIDEMPFSTRARNILKAHRVSTLGDLADVIAAGKMGQWRGCGQSTIKEVEEIAAPYLPAAGAEPAVLADGAPTRDSAKPRQARKGDRGTDTVLERALTPDERKLAAAIPIEELGLAPRCEEGLRDRGLWRLIDLAMAPMASLQAFGDLQRAHIDAIVSAVKAKLGDIQTPTGDTILGRVMSASEEEIAKSLKVSELPLSTRAINVLKQLRWSTVHDVACARMRDLEYAKNVGVNTVHEIRDGIAGALASPDHTHAIATILGRAMTDSEAPIARRTSIKALRLSGRARRFAEAQGWQTLADLALAICSEVEKQDRVGETTVSELRAAARQALSSKANDPKGSVLGRALTEAEMEDSGKTPVEDLAISRRAHAAILRAGWSNALSVATGRLEQLRWAARQDDALVGDIKKALLEALKNPPHRVWDSRSAESLPDLVRWIANKLEDRDRAIVERRHGLWDGEPETLEDIASTLGITRERVRQIQAKSERALTAAFRDRVLAYMKGLGGMFGKFLDESGGIASAEELQEGDFGQDSPRPKMAFDFLCAALGLSAGDFFPDDAAAGERLFFDKPETRSLYLKAIESAKLALTMKGKPASIADIQSTLPPDAPTRLKDAAFLKRCFEVSSEIGIDATGKVGLKRWPFFDPQAIPEMAHRALLELGRPAHFTHVLDRMNLLFPDRAPFSQASVVNSLRTTGTFVRVGKGIWALANWGIKKPPFIKDFLAEALRARGGVATADELVAAGRTKHGYKETSMRMTLVMTPNLFTPLPDGRFRLR